jgi:hypothetical protein
MADLTKTVKDAVYVTVGLGVLSFQRAQVRRREWRQQLQTQLTETRGRAQQLTQQLARDLERRLEPVVDQLEETLPGQARGVVKHARAAAKDVQGQLLALVGRSDAKSAA